jgi:hypothetical protein
MEGDTVPEEYWYSRTQSDHELPTTFSVSRVLVVTVLRLSPIDPAILSSQYVFLPVLDLRMGLSSLYLYCDIRNVQCV